MIHLKPQALTGLRFLCSRRMETKNWDLWDTLILLPVLCSSPRLLPQSPRKRGASSLPEGASAYTAAYLYFCCLFRIATRKATKGSLREGAVAVRRLREPAQVPPRTACKEFTSDNFQFAKQPKPHFLPTHFSHIRKRAPHISPDARPFRPLPLGKGCCFVITPFSSRRGSARPPHR